MAFGRPISLTKNIANRTITVFATAGQSLFTVEGGYRINFIEVYVNGVKLTNNNDYQAQDGATVNLNEAASLNDEISFELYDDFRVSNAIVSAASTQTISGNLNITGTIFADEMSLTDVSSSKLTIGTGTTIFPDGNVNNVGVVTVSSATVSKDLTVSRNSTLGLTTISALNVSGNVTVGGTLTYDDVVNVDAIGLVTARSGVQLGNTGSGVTISSPSTNNFALQTNAVDRVIINQNGSVGIGTTIPSDDHSSTYESIYYGGRGTLFNWDSSSTSNQTGILHNAYYSNSNEFRKRTSTTGIGAGVLRIINTGAAGGANQGYLEFGSGITTSGPGIAMTARFEVNMDGTVKIKNTDQVCDFTDTTIDPSLFVSGGVSAGQYNSGGSIGFSKINSTTVMGAAIAAEQTGSDTDQMGLSFYTHPSTSNGTSLTKAVTLNHEGYLGIGTNSVSNLLHVRKDNAGTAVAVVVTPADRPVSIDAGQFVQFSRTAAVNGLTFSGADGRLLTGAVNPHNMVGWRGPHLFLQGNNNISFFNGTGEIARMDGDSRVMIGSTVMTTGTSNNRVNLTVNKGIHASHGNGSTGNDWNDYWGAGGASLIVGQNGYLGTNGSYALDLVGNGYRNTSGGWTSLSSYNNNGNTRSMISLRPTSGGTGGINFNCDAATTGSGPAIRMKLNPSGAFIVSSENGAQDTDFIGQNRQGIAMMGNTNGGGINMHVTSGDCVKIGRSQDGNLIRFFKNDGSTALQGYISMASGTVTYGEFLGIHPSVLSNWSTPDIKPGTIMDTINESIVKLVAKFTVIESNDGGDPIEVEKRVPYNGNGTVGDNVALEYQGQLQHATLALYDENIGLNKNVKVKVNDTAGSRAVHGVFVGYEPDEDDSQFDSGHYNEMKIGAVGNYFIRIAAGQTPQIGDLIEANGAGCGVCQSDDIIRSKTVGKITSTTPQKIYDDGTFLLTAVLYCG